MRAMRVLRRTLAAGGLLQLLLAIPLLVVPGWLTETVLGQVDRPGDVWLRLLGAANVSLALVHVLILRKLDDLWWWCWALVVFDALTVVISIAHAIAGVPEGSAAWPWWVVGAASAAFTVLYVVGLARAGQERPIT